MRLTLADPVTALAIGGAVVGGVGTLAQGGAAAAQQEAQAGFARAEARREEVQQARAQRDLQRERRRTLARTRAALSGEGGGTTTGAVLGQQAGEFGRQSARLRQDSEARQRSLRARGTNLDAAAGASRVGSVVAAGSQVAGGVSRTLLSRGGTGGGGSGGGRTQASGFSTGRVQTGSGFGRSFSGGSVSLR